MGGTRQADLAKPVRQLDSRAAEFDRGIEGFQIPTLSSQIARAFITVKRALLGLFATCE